MSKEDFLLVFGFFGTGPIFTALAIFIDNIILKWIFGIVAFLGIALIVFVLVFFTIDQQKEKKRKKQEPKSIYEYKILERFPINIEKCNQIYVESGCTESYKGREYCELIDESEEYRFYSYLTCSDGSGGYVLRQDKSVPDEVVYFGKNKQFNCVFNGYLFQVDGTDELWKGFGITARNVYTGELVRCDWLSKKGHFVLIGGYGRVYSQDTVNNVFIKDDKLIFEVSRVKSDDPFEENDEFDENDIDVNYTLVVKYVFGEFKVSRFFENN